MESSIKLPKVGKKRINKLDRDYNKFIENLYDIHSEDSMNRLEIYNAVINELTTLDEQQTINELKYRITDGENPNSVILDIINRYSVESHFMWLISKNIEQFIYEDLIKVK
jgi:hypothetical protein